ncbi:MAG: DUF416 family protein [Mesorhizobium sp.]|nr:MAG: DUF416 family protein [Mesorhizobium sp.]
MIQLMSKKTTKRLLSLSTKKKMAFLVLLYERMCPDLRFFCLTEGRDFSVFEKAHRAFWIGLKEKETSISWNLLYEEILAAAPDSEEFGSWDGSYALNAALVAAEIAAFAHVPQDQNVIDAIGYARNSLDAKASSEVPSVSYTSAEEVYIDQHPLVEIERNREKDDVEFLSSIDDSEWYGKILPEIEMRASAQSSLLRRFQ